MFSMCNQCSIILQGEWLVKGKPFQSLWPGENDVSENVFCEKPLN